MKNREKFLAIFALVFSVLMLLCIIRSSIELNKISENATKFNNEFENGYETGNYTLELEQEINEMITHNSTMNERDKAIDDVLSKHIIENYTQALEWGEPLNGIINIVFYSFAITIFIYFALIIEYKSKKQYLLANLLVFIMLGIISIIERMCIDTITAFSFGDIDISYYFEREIITKYLLYLMINSIKNKNKLLIFNVATIYVMLIINAIFSYIIDGIINISWYSIFISFLAFVIIEMLVLRHKNVNKQNKLTKERKTNEK